MRVCRPIKPGLMPKPSKSRYPWGRALVLLAAGTSLVAGPALADYPSLFRLHYPPRSQDSVQAFGEPELHAVIARELGVGLMRYANADQGVSLPIENHGGILLGKSCRPHDCGTNQIQWAVGRNGNVYVRLTINNQRDSFGSATPEVNGLFDAQG